MCKGFDSHSQSLEQSSLPSSHPGASVQFKMHCHKSVGCHVLTVVLRPLGRRFPDDTRPRLHVPIGTRVLIEFPPG